MLEAPSKWRSSPSPGLERIRMAQPFAQSNAMWRGTPDFRPGPVRLCKPGRVPAGSLRSRWSREYGCGTPLCGCTTFARFARGKTGGGGVPPPPKVCPALQAPMLRADDAAQLKSPTTEPLPRSCSEVPTGVPLLSDTGRLRLVLPAAGPLPALIWNELQATARLSSVSVVFVLLTPSGAWNAA